MKEALNHISGVDLYPILSLGLFMTVFIVMLIWVARLRKPYLDEVSQLPLSGEEEEGGNHARG